MLYKDILFNNQGIKEVRCADEVIWRKKIEKLFKLKYSSSYSSPFLSCMQVEGNTIYALIRLDNEHSSVAKIKIDGEKLSLSDQLIVKSVSSVLVVDRRNKNLVYIVGCLRESDIYLNLLCIDTNTWRMKSMSDTSVKNCYSFGYSDQGILLYNSFELFFFEYEYPYSWSYNSATFDDTTMKVTRLDIPRGIQGFQSFTKNSKTSDLCYLGVWYTEGNKVKHVIGHIMAISQGNGTTKVYISDPMEIPFYIGDLAYNIFADCVIKGSVADISPVFVSREGYVYILDHNTFEIFKSRSLSDYTKKQSYTYKLNGCGVDLTEYWYDDDSKMLTVKARESDYKQTKKEFFKSYLVDREANSSNKNIYPKWSKELTDKDLSMIFYGNKDMLLYSRRSDERNEFVLGYEKF